MDPLSIVAASASLIGAVGKTSVVVTEFIRGCRDARADLTAVSRELFELKLVLELLRDDTGTGLDDENLIPGAIHQQILSILENCENILGHVNKVLDKHSGRTSPIRWTVFGKEEVVVLRTSLEAHRGALSLTLDTLNL